MKADSPWDVVGRQGLTMRDRFEDKFEKRGSDECWEWKGVKDRDGYGLPSVPKHYTGTKTRIGAHRLSLDLYTGEFHEDLVVLHSCDNPSCVNPAHLSWGTPSDNVADRDAKRRTYRTVDESTILDIRKLRSLSTPLVDIARMLELPLSTVQYYGHLKYRDAPPLRKLQHTLDVESAIQMRESGSTYEQIAEALGVSRTTATRLIKGTR